MLRRLDKVGQACTPAVVPGAAPPRPKLGRGRQTSMRRGKSDKKKFDGDKLDGTKFERGKFDRCKFDRDKLDTGKSDKGKSEREREREREGLTEVSLIEINWRIFEEASLIAESWTEIDLIQVSPID